MFVSYREEATVAAIPYPYLGVGSRVGGPAGRPAAGQSRPSHLRLVVGGDAALDALGRSEPAYGDDALARQRVRLAARRRTVARRRRVTTTLFGVAALTGAWFGLGALTSLGHASASRLPDATLVRGGQLYVARPGDTLWSIATRLEPNGDPRPIVDQLSSELGGRPLLAGTRLLLPR